MLHTWYVTMYYVNLHWEHESNKYLQIGKSKRKKIEVKCTASDLWRISLFKDATSPYSEHTRDKYT